METSLNWLYRREESYRASSNRPTWSISDWHNDPDDVAMPLSMLSRISPDANSCMRYRFLDSIQSTKESIRSFYRTHFEIELLTNGLAVCQNSTAALNLLMKALAASGVRRVLVITPAYFSIFNLLRIYGQETVFVHGDLLKDPCLSVAQIEGVARCQMADAIFITNPIFSTGIALDRELIRRLVSLSDQFGTWIILDETLGGLPWSSDPNAPFVPPGMPLLVGHPRCGYIWSVSKSLFLNGLKHSAVLAPKDVIERIEKDADVLIGGFVAQQISLIESVYSGENREEISRCAMQNVARFSATYHLCQNGIRASSLRLTAADSGFHASAFLPPARLDSTELSRAIVGELMKRHGISAIPLAHFGFPPYGPIGFRVNLSKDAGRLLEGLVRLTEVLNEDSDLS